MSERNGDKARFGRLRKRRTLERKRIRELRETLGAKRQAQVSGKDELKTGQ